MLKGLGNLANLGSIVKQAQEMGSKMEALGDQLKTQRATGNAGGGLIEVDVNGLGEVLAVRIDPALVERQDREMIEDLLPAAFNAAHQKAKQLHAEALEGLAGGMAVPGLEKALAQLGGAIDPPDAPPAN